MGFKAAGRARHVAHDGLRLVLDLLFSRQGWSPLSLFLFLNQCACCTVGSTAVVFVCVCCSIHSIVPHPQAGATLVPISLPSIDSSLEAHHILTTTALAEGLAGNHDWLRHAIAHAGEDSGHSSNHSEAFQGFDQVRWCASGGL